MKKHDTDPPACTDCWYFDHHFMKCYHDNCSTFDVVEGRQPVWASDARKSGACGSGGKFFEPIGRWHPTDPSNVFFWAVVGMIVLFVVMDVLHR